MQSGIPDLWPSEVDETAVLTPVAILRHQAALLGSRSHNILEAEVVSEPSPANNGDVWHGLELIVPALDFFRVRLLTVGHDRMRAYPVSLRLGATPYGSADKGANSQSEFVIQLGVLLGSDSVRSVIHSLLAQANDAKEDRRAVLAGAGDVQSGGA